MHIHRQLAAGMRAVTSGAVSPLSLMQSPQSAYSLRDLTSTGNDIVQLRRSSDSTQQWFTGAELLDGTATTWAGGSATINVSALKDQVGWGNAPNLPDDSKLKLEFDANGIPYIQTIDDSFGSPLGFYEPSVNFDAYVCALHQNTQYMPLAWGENTFYYVAVQDGSAVEFVSSSSPGVVGYIDDVLVDPTERQVAYNLAGQQLACVAICGVPGGSGSRVVSINGYATSNIAHSSWRWTLQFYECLFDAASSRAVISNVSTNVMNYHSV